MDYNGFKFFQNNRIIHETSVRVGCIPSDQPAIRGRFAGQSQGQIPSSFSLGMLLLMLHSIKVESIV